MSANECKWVQMSANECMWEQVSAGKCKWVQMSASEEKWAEVSDDEFDSHSPYSLNLCSKAKWLFHTRKNELEGNELIRWTYLHVIKNLSNIFGMSNEEHQVIA